MFISSRQALAVAGGVGLLALTFFGGVQYHRLTEPKGGSIDFNGLNDLYATLQHKFDGSLDRTKALEGAKEGLTAAAGDPYTVYLDAAAAKELNDEINGTLSGIGAEIGMKNKVITVIAPLDQSPAAKAGVKAGDMVAKINDQDTSSLTVDQAVQKIRGQAGTTVKLTLVRTGAAEPITLTITRAVINVPSVKWSMKDGGVGDIKISQFGPDTARLIDQAAGELTAQGAKKFVLDLRDDPGGYLDAGISVASEFLPAGKLVVEEKRLDGSSDVKHDAAGGGKLVGLPVVVLVNAGSASASEIVAGALHDNGAARLVGEKTFGKGSVQEIQELSGGDELKVTVAHWYTPKGVNISQQGITPDVTVGLTDGDANASRDPQLDRALQLLSSAND